MTVTITIYVTKPPTSRLTVVSRKATEEVPREGLSTNAREYFTRTNLEKCHNLQALKACTLLLQIINVRIYKPKLKPAGPCSTLCQLYVAFSTCASV